MNTIVYLWRSKTDHQERYGQECTIVSFKASLVHVCFSDGTIILCHRRQIKRKTHDTSTDNNQQQSI